ncbi:MAG: hypothetical protein KBB54_02245 [Candidatus Pacebacteria bacterium]|nr:hypothetical protein [Candidatus Paceibacterota bacterium]MBP9818968.1 hypothetical protein [Candidatus Paceibacterota bacterium]
MQETYTQIHLDGYPNISKGTTTNIFKHIGLIVLMLSIFAGSYLWQVPTVFAEVRYEDKTFTQSITLKSINQPYYFSGSNAIARGVTVMVDKGTRVYVDGNITVLGKLVLAGEKDFPIQIKRSNQSIDQNSSQGSDQNIFTIIGGEFFASYVEIKDIPGVAVGTTSSSTSGFLESGLSQILNAFSTSTVVFDSVFIDLPFTNISSGASISVFNNSALSIKNSILKNINSRYGIEVFNKSSIDIQKTTLAHVGSDTSIVIYGNGSTASIEDSLLYGTVVVPVGELVPPSTQIATQTPPSTPTTKAIEIFSGAFMETERTDFERFSAKAISAFSNATIDIFETVFTQNRIGIESYNSNIKISESEIFGNTEQGAITYGGTIVATDNWWGSHTGPRSIPLNPNGTGDAYIGNGQISPWKDSKPKKKTVCCSSVLFIPGHQGSRIYKKGMLMENQLWEPNTTSDITSLYLTTDGYSMNKSLYLRDIIDRTNILFGGNDDVEIYKGLIHALNGLNSNFSIEDWQFSAYDWRMSPNTIVTEGTRYTSPTGQYKKMEDQIVQMSQVSKTKKVTLVAHSYGGLVTKRFLAYLTQRGKIGLIDKVIFVGVPETGSPASLFALLHGDNQDIGNGYIVNTSTMRKFAENMPSAYALLPKTNSNLIFGMNATNTIATSVPNISTVASMYQFLFNEISRPNTIDWLETNIPLTSNKKLKQKIDIESTASFIKPQTDPAYANIEFYNILGVGLDTVESISYTKKPCVSLYTHPSLMSPNCGLDHVPNFSQLGDGVVLADDVLNHTDVETNDSAVWSFDGKNSKRWGEKYMFNIAEYNRKNSKNYSHANIVSAPPVISTLMQIMLQTVGSYALPQYIVGYGGVRLGGNGQAGTSTSIVGGVDTSSDTYTHKKYQLSTSDAVFISTKDTLGNVSGVHFPALSTMTSTRTSKTPQIVPVQNSAPNSNISHVGSTYYLQTENLPSSVTLKPDPIVSEATSPVLIDFKIKEIETIPGGSLGGSTSVSTTTEKVIASFEQIPITEYSTVEVKIDLASTTQVEMKVTDRYEDIYVQTMTYIVTPQSSPNALLQGTDTSTGGSSGTGSTTVGGGGSPVGGGGGQTGGSIDIVYLTNLIRTEIQKSGLRLNFKQRYILKLNTIEKNYKLLIESKKRLARLYAKDTTASLLAIIKDLNRSRALYYRGGMRKSEAAFLYSQFSRLSRAFGD